MPNFSICLIARNEETTLPRLLKTLEEFKSKGGEVVLLDTGSTDKTAQVAREWGCKVEEVGDRFVRYVNKQMADNINKMFSVDEGEIVKEGDKNFDFASARNYCASLASNNMVSMPDCDEIFTKLDIEAVDKYIEDGWEQLEFNFVFAHNPDGSELIKFVQCKFYNRKKLKWTGIIHEVLEGEAKRVFMPENIFKIEHYQNESTDRKGYLVGLAIDCYENQAKDRNSHYFARELMWRGFSNSAIKEFKRHIAMKAWATEASKSLIFIGDILMGKGKEEDALDYYHRAYLLSPDRREPLLKMGKYFFYKKEWEKCIFYLEGCLRIKYSGFYADDLTHYGAMPHGMLYVAYWYVGDKEKGKEHFDKAIELEPNNEIYNSEKKFYYPEYKEYKGNNIDGWMTEEELQFLYNNAKRCKTVLEIGSWKGKSTHALLSAGVKVTAVDHFKGSADVNDGTNTLGKQQDIYKQFMDNVGSFENLEVLKMSSAEAKEKLGDTKFDMIFIDGEHTYEAVKYDIELWKDNAEVILCGHDYQMGWQGVMKAVDEALEKTGVGEGTSIWYKNIEKKENSELILDELIIKLKDNKNFSFIKRGDGEEACMNGDKGANCDGSVYYPELGGKLKDAYKYFDTIKNCYVPKFDKQKYYNSLLHRTDNDLKKVKEFYELIVKSNRKKIYIGPQRLGIVPRILGCSDHIVVPEVDGFTDYYNIWRQLAVKIEKEAILLFSCGMMAKPLIAESLRKEVKLTCIDLGSSFDPIVGQTRTEQIKQEEMFELYREYMPMISIIIPTLGRPEGLKRAVESLKLIKYPNSRLEVIIKQDEPRMGVAKRLNQGYKESKGDFIVYGSNDIEFTPDCIINALAYSTNYNLIAFNTGELLPDQGNICEHFMIKADYVFDKLNGKIFDEDFNHVGVDNLLWNKTDNKIRAEKAIIKHYHFSKGGKWDEIYELGWKDAANDRELLKNKLSTID